MTIDTQAPAFPDPACPDPACPSPERLPDNRNWIASTGLDRRSLLVGGAFAAGFAAACQPVAATTIQTSGDALIESHAIVKGSDGFAIPLFVARPKSGKPAPVIIVVHEIFGVHAWVQDMCRRFAKAGYCAVAPDLFARHGDATKIADFQRLIDMIVSKTSDAQVMRDIDSALAWAGTHGGDAGRQGITGFCWGGRIVWLYAEHSRALDAGVAFYGQVLGRPNPLQPANPIDRVADLRAPVLGQYGGRDKGILAADLNAMRAKLQAAGKAPPARIIIYPGADHGFMADYRPSYNADAATAAWTATIAWFDRYVKRS